ncbi:hypothetical protein [Wenyingzhuangia sp. IMCC45574]
MKYLNKNIEELGKKSLDKSLINSSTSGGIVLKCDLESNRLKHYLQHVKKAS